MVFDIAALGPEALDRRGIIEHLADCRDDWFGAVDRERQPGTDDPEGNDNRLTRKRPLT